MKKLLITIASLFLLAGCASAQAASRVENKVEPKNTTPLIEEVKPVVVYGERSASVYPRGRSEHKT